MKKLLLGLVALAVIGCGVDGTKEPTAGTNQAVDKGPAIDPALRQELERGLTAYAEGLLRGDLKEAALTMTAELQGRTVGYMSGPAAAWTQQEFIARERKKIVRELKLDGDVLDAPFVLTNVVFEDGRLAARASFSYRGKVLIKPFYFVYVEGSYRLNVVSPRYRSEVSALSCSTPVETYAVKNWTGDSRHVICGECVTNSANIPGNTTGGLICENNCGFWTGTYIQNAAAHCDYNTWGDDVHVYVNSVECNDEC